MKKMKLILEQLAVDSFETAAAPEPRGTVFGEQNSGYFTICTCGGQPTCDGNATCLGYTCAASCDLWTCDGHTCDASECWVDTCAFTCGHTCPC